MPSTSTKALLVAGSVVLIAVAASQMRPQVKQARGATDISDDDDLIDEDLVVKIFDRLFLEMQAVIARLSQQVQQIQMSGQVIPESQLRKLLTAEFERALMARQAEVYKEHEVDADCLEEATWEFMEDEEEHPKVKRAVERFQKLYESISGETVVGRRPGVKIETKEATILDSTKTIEAATVFFGALSKTMKDAVDKFKAEGKNLSDIGVQQELQMKFSAMANDAGEAALEGIGVSLKDFQASVEKNASDPQVARTLTMLQMQQQKDLMDMGMAPGM